MKKENMNTDVPALPEGELEALAHCMAMRRANYIVFLERTYKLTREEAVQKANEDALSDAERAAEFAEKPARQVQWFDFDRVAEFDPDQALSKWQEIKRTARAELESGQRACEVQYARDPWARAQFLAVRQSMIDEWQPQGGIELSLIDQLAQTYSGWMTWLEDFHYIQQAEVNRRTVREEEELSAYQQRYVPPRLTEAEYAERALRMAERFQRMYMRSLRALRDLRRYVGHVTINNAGPLSVGGNQQVNVSK